MSCDSRFTSLRYKTHQSYITPSALMPAKANTPMTKSVPRGQAKCAFDSGLALSTGMASIHGAVDTASSATPKPTPASCQAGSTSRRNKPPVSAAPNMPPTLNMPCKPPMMVRLPSSSNAEPSVLMATSYKLSEAPNTSIDSTSKLTEGQCNTKASMQPIRTAARDATRRAPKVPITRPAVSKESTAPTAADMSTSDKVISPNP